MAPTCWRGRHRGRAKKKRHKKRSKLKIQTVAAGRRGPRTPEQESCTPIPVQVRIYGHSLHCWDPCKALSTPAYVWAAVLKLLLSCSVLLCFLGG